MIRRTPITTLFPYTTLFRSSDLGDKIALSIRSFFKNEGNLELIQRLKNYGLRFAIEEKESTQVSDKFAGMIMVVSGKFEQFSRDEIKQKIEDYGGKNNSSITDRK